jgi:hypothetical protein
MQSIKLVVWSLPLLLYRKRKNVLTKHWLLQLANILIYIYVCKNISSGGGGGGLKNIKKKKFWQSLYDGW